MSRDGHFWPAFGAIHARHASPYRAVGLVCSLSVSFAVGLLMGGVPAESAIDYLAQLCCFGFIIAYSFIGVAAPFFLLKNGLLHWPAIANAILTLAILVLVLAFNIFPIQPAPYCYFIFIFCGTVVIATCTSLFQPAIKQLATSTDSVPDAPGGILDASKSPE
jgi:amino acid transporter